MSSGIRATVEFATPDVCPIADLSARTEDTIDAVTVSVCAGECSECVLEFSVHAHADVGDDFTPIFSHDASTRYRLTRGRGAGCPCVCLGELGCAVDRYTADEGTLTLVFYASGFEELRRVVQVLRERFPGVNIKRFIRSPAGDPTQHTVYVDRSRLTDRQLEVLTLAYERGYFERPRRANATELAAELGIDPSTFGQHLAAAQSKLLRDVLSDHT